MYSYLYLYIFYNLQYHLVFRENNLNSKINTNIIYLYEYIIYLNAYIVISLNFYTFKYLTIY